MKTIEDNFKTKLNYDTFVALGSFDGLHLGHISLINKTVEKAKECNCRSMVITFKNHPLTVIDKNAAPKLLMDNDLKESLIEKLGVDLLNFINFDDSFMRISPEDFILNMVKHYNIKGIVVGFNYRFGFKNLGNVDLLLRFCNDFNIELHVIPPIMHEGEVISSTRIRNMLQNGMVEEANKMLMQPYCIGGTVVSGKRLGRTIEFPTANLKFEDSYVLPKTGVYLTAVEYDNHIYKGITNVGLNPTVDGRELSVETYILDFNADIYGEHLKVFFIRRMRDEKNFISLGALKMQLISDKKYAENQNIETF